jgi:hypothetical protein
MAVVPAVRAVEPAVEEPLYSLRYCGIAAAVSVHLDVLTHRLLCATHIFTSRSARVSFATRCDHFEGARVAAKAPQGRKTSTDLRLPERRTYVHMLSLRLTEEQYRRLRRFVMNHEERTGQRTTHQAVLEAALVVKK